MDKIEYASFMPQGFCEVVFALFCFPVWIGLICAFNIIFGVINLSIGIRSFLAS